MDEILKELSLSEFYIEYLHPACCEICIMITR